MQDKDGQLQIRNFRLKHSYDDYHIASCSQVTFYDQLSIPWTFGSNAVYKNKIYIINQVSSS